MGSAVSQNVVEIMSELGNVGMGKATNVLGNMLKTRMSVDIPNVVRSEPNELMRFFDGNDENVGVVMSFCDDISGSILFTAKKDFTKKLLRQLVDDDEYNESLFAIDEQAVSTIRDVADVMMKSYLSAISDYTGFETTLDSGMVCIDRIRDMLLYPMSKLENHNENNICIESRFSICNVNMESNGQGAQGHILFFPENDSLNKIVGELNCI